MAKASLSIEVDNPKDFLAILKDPGYTNNNVKIKAEGSQLSISVVATSQKEAISNLDSIVKKLLVISSAKSAVKDLEKK